ncbi:MAG: hypothetical protein IKU98_04240 [Bacteroidaceae bacterium]|nr:hypothetical protein [Bacteroidaceae bacterium]
MINVKTTKVTQENVYALIPHKVSKLANRLLADKHSGNLEEAIMHIYNSKMYRNLETESTKFWWYGTNMLYEELMEEKG